MRSQTTKDVACPGCGVVSTEVNELIAKARAEGSNGLMTIDAQTILIKCPHCRTRFPFVIPNMPKPSFAPSPLLGS